MRKNSYKISGKEKRKNKVDPIFVCKKWCQVCKNRDVSDFAEARFKIKKHMFYPQFAGLTPKIVMLK